VTDEYLGTADLKPWTAIWRNAKDFPKALSFSAAISGVLIVLVSIFGTGPIVLQAAKAGRFTDAQTTSWFLTMLVGSGIYAIYLSLRMRMPTAGAWCTPSTALLVTGLVNHKISDVVGAYLIASILIITIGAFGWFERILLAVPRPVTMAMLAGILFSFGVDIFPAISKEPLIVLIMIATFFLGRRFHLRAPIIPSFIIGLVVAALSGAVDSNLEIREDLYQFNLLVAPGYPELIDNLVTLNTDRGETAFVIGDTPMTLPATTTAITNWNKNTDGNGLATASPYLGVYYPSGITTDLSGNTVAVPPSYAVLRTFLYSDNVSNPWFAPAGTHRGLVSNIQDVGYVNANTGAWVHNSIGQGLRDALYTLSINPVTQLPGVGIVVWGQETKSGASTARNRVNVVRLENYLRNIFKSVANGFLFEPNDQITRKSISTQIESALHDILSKRGVYDFLVVCDGTNNTSSTIANNQLYVDVAIEPARDVEFIYIPIALYNPGSLASLGTSSS